MRNGLVSLLGSFGDHLLAGGLSGFPVMQFQAVLDHLLLAGAALSSILLVRFLERVES